jgi:nitroreductase
MNAEELMTIIKTRRSVRKFIAEAVPRADVEKIIEAGQWAPSGANTQNWFFMAIYSTVIKEKMAAAIRDKVEGYAQKITSPRAKREFMAYSNFYMFFADAPVVIAVVKKPYVSLNLRIMDRYNIPLETRSSSDAQGPAAAVENMMLMAHAMGYGTCWMTGPLIARKELEEVLAVEPQDELMALIPLGKPAVAPGPSARKELSRVYRIIE